MNLTELIIFSFLVSLIGGFVGSWIFKTSVLAGSVFGLLLFLFWLSFWWIFFPFIKKFWQKIKNLSNLQKGSFLKSVAKFLLFLSVIIAPIFLHITIVDFCKGSGFTMYVLFTYAFQTIAIEVATSFLYNLNKFKYLLFLGCLLYSILIHVVSVISLTVWLCK